MENLRNAVQTEQLAQEQRRTEYAERQRIEQQQRDEAREQKIRESNERATEFVALMREKQVPMTIYRRMLPEAGPVARDMRHRDWQTIPGWLAVPHETVHIAQDHYDSFPGVFVAEDAQTYYCSTTIGRGGEIKSDRILGSPDPTLLAGDRALQSMVSFIASRRII